MVPQSERHGTLSDILKRIRHQQSTAAQSRIGSKVAVSELSRSMMDLSIHNKDANQDERGVPVPRLKAGVSV